MRIFYQEEVSADASKRGKCVASALKNAFSKRHSKRAKLPYSSPPQPDDPPTDFNQEEEVLVSAVMNKYMEWKNKCNIKVNSLCNFLGVPMEYGMNGDELVWGGGSHISSSDDAANFVSANTCFSPSCSSISSLTNIDHFIDMRNRSSIMLEFIHCEGWPFGLCRNALLLPPLPKSPVDSWSWKKQI
ncbi:hypothetical protein ACS0TY_024252 [Phlomoides rotata]